MTIDRSARVVVVDEASRAASLPRAGPVLDALTLLLLLTDASPLAIPFAVHVSVDSCLTRLERAAKRAGRPNAAQAAGNARAVAGAAMSALTLGFATASAQAWCGGRGEPAALAIAARLFSLLADLIDVARRVGRQNALARLARARGPEAR